MYRSRIIKIAKKYGKLDSVIYEEEDLIQEAIEAVIDALNKCKYTEDVIMRFPTFLEWKIKNRFQKRIKGKDRFVEIYSPDGSHFKTMSYTKFVTQKKELKKKGYVSVVKKKCCCLTDALSDHVSIAADNEQYFEALDDYHADHLVTSERDVDEISLLSEQDNYEEIIYKINHSYKNYSRPGADKDTEFSFFREWVYNLYGAHGNVLIRTKYVENDDSFSPEDIKEIIYNAISRAIRQFEEVSSPGIAFHLFLEVLIKRMVQKKRQH